MYKMIRANLRLSLQDLAIELGIVAGVWLLLEAGTNLVVGLAKESTTAIITAPTLLVVGGLALLFVNAARFMVEFPRGVRFSVTQRRMLAGLMAVCTVHTAAVLGLSALLGAVSGLIYKLAWQPRGVELAFDGLALFPWWGWLAVAAACILGGLVGGALYLRFGPKGMWVMWGAWMVFVFFDEQILGLFSGLQALPGLAWLGGLVGPVVLVGVVALLALSVRWLLRLTVREG